MYGGGNKEKTEAARRKKKIQIAGQREEAERNSANGHYIFRWQRAKDYGPVRGLITGPRDRYIHTRETGALPFIQCAH